MSISNTAGRWFPHKTMSYKIIEMRLTVKNIHIKKKEEKKRYQRKVHLKLDKHTIYEFNWN